MKDQTAPRERRPGGLVRFLPVAGVAYAALTFAGDLTIGEFPDSSTPLAELSRYYAAHSGTVRAGGQLMIWGALCLGLFGVAVWTRVREAAGPPAVAGLVLVGTAIEVTSDLSGAGHYVLLGSIGADPLVTPQALQAWQVGTDVWGGGGLLLMLGLAAAGLFSRAVPSWLAWSALMIGIAELTPFGFYAELLGLLWAAVAGIALSLRTVEPAPTRGTAAAAPARA